MGTSVLFCLSKLCRVTIFSDEALSLLTTMNMLVTSIGMAEQASYSLASQLMLARLARTHLLLASSLESNNIKNR